MKKEIVICDIDGCLNTYPKIFLKWVEKTNGIKVGNLEALKELLSKKEYEKLKYKYRTCGVKRILPLRKNAAKTIEEINKNKKIWILSSRPTFKPVKEDTLYWLRKNKIKYDRIVFLTKRKKLELIKKIRNKICFIIDDTPDVVFYCSQRLKIPVYFFKNGQRIKNKSSLLFPVGSWQKIMDSFKNLYEKNKKNKIQNNNELL